MGMPALSPSYFSVDQVLALPDDGKRRELVYGELLVSPAPQVRHQRIVLRLARILAGYCEREGLGEVFVSPADLTWGRPDVLAQPDVFVVGQKDAGVHSWADVRHVDLIAEVVSPSSRRHDRFQKRTLYRDRQVGIYWILDADASCAEVWTPASHFPAIERGHLMWQPEGAAMPLEIQLGSLLAP